ncbi:hypothetical protein [Bradyrhizobium sp. CCBAU 53338]|uniref:hypothetical protein n=1 Tax=Bradyrhizobium sp. CCBAU 53338 TaxID=1325111 RepID=UPI00188B9F91|nr:hypothetical protein [Bradyrhizobium sp. CCBAU 53338]QOZ52226.1 hypothetical protein XH90_13220 [Bradyrhizobium sp. CCBAU 53338]
MTSESQLRANRTNAAKSTGPRSRHGKKRASQNSFKHGLAKNSAGHTGEDIEHLARELAGQDAEMRTLENARSLARANIDLAHIRSVKTSMLRRILQFGRLHRPYYLLSQLDPIVLTEQEMRRAELAFQSGKLPRLRRRKTKPMPELAPERTAESLRRLHSEFSAIDRYHYEASARFSRALGRFLRTMQRGYIC